ncbi:hypothetical protein KFE25_004434 [Diacronema lutheri]|uniref:J domain-containing protein n=1 Tax=Diacronema lutheri TaxID=2081491 RepID=A0A8J5X7K5_DIALT|nr:hypothetical protein KFE25_004434 [Diacronema lutheri]
MPSVATLRELLRERGLPTEGYAEKGEMVAALVDAGLARAELDAIDARDAAARRARDDAAAAAAAEAARGAAEVAARKAYAAQLKGSLASLARGAHLPSPRPLPPGLLRALACDDDDGGAGGAGGGAGAAAHAPSTSAAVWGSLMMCAPPALPALCDLGLSPPSLASLGLAPAAAVRYPLVRVPDRERAAHARRAAAAAAGMAERTAAGAVGPARVLGELSVGALLGDVASASAALFGDALGARPRDALAGAACGASQIAKGVAAGTLGLVTAPVRGAREGGLAGFAEGLGRGLVGAVALPAAGVAVAAVQLGWGVAGTPEAVVRACAGQSWDAQLGRWAAYSLPQELADVRTLGDRRELLARLAERLAAADAAGSVAAAERARRGAARGAAVGGGGGGVSGSARASGASASGPSGPASAAAAAAAAATGRSVASRAHYDTLGVEPGASGAEIRRAYYTRAREAHPDKRPGDEAAAAEFQRLSAAYQTLSSPQQRALYDELGEAADGAARDGAAGAAAVDASVFFAVLFGSEQFDYLTGQFALAAATQLGIDAAMHPAALAARHAAGDAADAAELQRRGGTHWGAHSYGRTARVGVALGLAQRAREVEVAAKLSVLLAPHADAAADAAACGGGGGGAAGLAAAGFESFWRGEARRLAAVAFGRPLLLELADAYAVAARAWLGTRAGATPAGLADALGAALDGSRAALAHRADVASAALGATTAAARVAVTAAAAEEAAGGPAGGLAAAWAEAFAPGAPAHGSAGVSAGAAAVRAALPALLKAAWAISALDVRATALGACERLLGDTAVSPARRAGRASALLRLAAIFREVGADDGAAGAPAAGALAPPRTTALAAPAAERERALARIDAECARAKEAIEGAVTRTVLRAAERARERRDATEEREARARDERHTAPEGPRADE